MLLLVTVGLVLAGLILLIVGFVQDSLTLIYLSIACAAIAGLALIVFSRLSRRQAVTMAAEGVPAAAAPASPLVTAAVAPAAGTMESAPPARPSVPARPAPAPEPAVARAATAADDDRFDPGEPTSPQPLRAPVAAAAAEATTALEQVRVPAAADPAPADEWEVDWGDEVLFPIEDYDELRVAEIVPLLPELDPDELEEVRDREAATKNRASIIARIDELLGTTAPPAKTPAPAKKAPARKAPAAKSAASKAPAPAGKTAAKKAPAPSKTAPSKTAASKAAASKAAAPAKKASAKEAPSKAPASKKAAPAKKAAAASKATRKRA